MATKQTRKAVQAGRAAVGKPEKSSRNARPRAAVQTSAQSRREIERSSSLGKRSYSVAQLVPYLIRSGVIENPDEVLRQFGGWEGIRVYFRMMRQFPFLGSPINQRIDPVLDIERTIVPGDSSAMAETLAQDARRWWARVRDQEIILKKLLLAPFVGFHPIEKVWSVDPATGLICPFGEHADGRGLFTVSPANVKFDAFANPRIVSPSNYNGTPVEPGKLMFARWGSNETGYGEGELKDVYLATWYMQIILEFGVEALEQLGRPIPIVHIPRDWEQEEIDDYEKGIAEDFALYMTAPTNQPDVKVEFPGISVAAGGNAGRGEQEWLRYLESWCWNRLINTTQTQDRGGAGNGKLEEQRAKIKNPKTAYTSKACDAWLTEGTLDEIGERNWPNQPREIWPKFRSDTSEVSENGLTGVAAETVERVLLRLGARQIAEETCEDIITSVGVPRARALRMIAAQVEARDKGELELAPDIAGTAAGEKEAA